MSERSKKTIDDLPHFQVTAVRQIENADRGAKDHELSGTIDQFDPVKEGQCYLLWSGDTFIAMSGEIRLSDSLERKATFVTSEGSLPDLLGSSLTYLNSSQDPLHVWMVAEPRWKWAQEKFQAIDAIFRR